MLCPSSNMFFPAACSQRKDLKWICSKPFGTYVCKTQRMHVFSMELELGIWFWGMLQKTFLHKRVGARKGYWVYWIGCWFLAIDNPADSIGVEELLCQLLCSALFHAALLFLEVIFCSAVPYSALFYSAVLLRAALSITGKPSADVQEAAAHRISWLLPLARRLPLFSIPMPPCQKNLAPCMDLFRIDHIFHYLEI